MVRIVDGKAKRKHLYPAVRADAKMMKWYINPDGTVIASKSYLGAGLCIIDMPISAVFDTVFLPLDLYGRYEYRKDQEQRQQPQQP